LTSRWSDNDVYGHVNNVIFYQWFDSAVNGWLIDEGLLDMVHGELVCLVVETRCSYFAPLSFPDDIELGLAVVAVGRSSIRYKIAVFKIGEEQCAANGEFVHVLVDRQSRRPVEIPGSWRLKLKIISARK
jgi:acyl-CoA thioester hydrolase